MNAKNLRFPSLSVLATAMSIPCVAACGADATSPADPRPADLGGEGQERTLSEALSAGSFANPTLTSPLSVVCPLITGVQQYLLPKVPSVNLQAHCSTDQVNDLYYNGSEALTNSLEDFLLVPAVTGGAFFCSIADSDGATVDGTLSSSLGRFGVTSQFNVTTRDAPNAHLTARRVGKFYLFGAGANLEVQDMDFKFPSEKTTGSSPWLGSYMHVQSAGIDWDISGSVTIPVGPVMVTITPTLGSVAPTRSMTNNGIYFSPTNDTNMLPVNYSYSTWNTCLQSSGCSEAGSAGAGLFQLDHALPCPTDITSGTDGTLPYFGHEFGAGCATQNFIFFDILNNWLHFGRPGAPEVGGADESSAGTASTALEPNHVITNTTSTSIASGGDATTAASLEVSAEFDAEVAKVTVDATVSLAARDGFAVRQHHVFGTDIGAFGNVVVDTALSAQSKATATVKVTIETDLLGPISDSFSFSLGDTGDREAPVAAGTTVPGYVSMQYRDGLTGSTEANGDYLTGINQYLVKGVPKSDPDSARLSCVLASTATTKAPVKTDNPGPFLQNVASNFVKTVHPCHVQVCNPAGTSETDYEWNGTQLAETTTHTPCSICTEWKMDLCDGSGKELNLANGGARFAGSLLLNPHAVCTQ